MEFHRHLRERPIGSIESVAPDAQRRERFCVEKTCGLRLLIALPYDRPHNKKWFTALLVLDGA